MAEGYRWYHSVNPDWIKARKFVFTATELRALVPAYKRWLRKKDPDAIDPDFAALIAEKISNTNGIDVNTFSWAARGHIMEPYAIGEYARINGKTMYHWDDYIIGDAYELIGFSPDGLDIPQNDDTTKYSVLDTGSSNKTIPCFVDAKEFGKNCNPSSMVEVKCYSPTKHMKAIVSKPEELEERYQLAVGMMVCPSIKKGALVFYNPTINIGGEGAYYQVDYTREDLKEEIELMQNILNLAKHHLRYVKHRILETSCRDSIYTEDEIYADFEEAERKINEIN